MPFYSWGADFMRDVSQVVGPAAFDDIGRAGRVAVQPHFVYGTVWTEGMREAIETSLGMRRSFADVPELDTLVAGLASLGTLSLFLPAD